LIALLFATAVINRQMNYSLVEALRIDRDQVMLLFFGKTPSDAIKDAIARVPGVTGVTAALAAPTNYGMGREQFRHAGSASPVTLLISPIDYNFFDFYRVEPLAGRLPSRSHGTDLFVPADTSRHLSVFVNEAAVSALGLATPAGAIGQQITGLNLDTPAPASITIAGVVPDIPIDSVRTRIQPTMYVVSPQASTLMSIRLAGRRIPETEAAIDAVWRRLGEPMAPSHLFLDLYYRRMYIDIIQQRRVLGALCGVAVFLAGLHRAAPHERDRHPQGDGRGYRCRDAHAAVGVQQAGALGQPHRLAGRGLGDEPVARWLCLSRRSRLVAAAGRLAIGARHRAGNRQRPQFPGGAHQSGERAAIRVVGPCFATTSPPRPETFSTIGPSRSSISSGLRSGSPRRCS
jgi:hypothetical protein